MQFTVNQSNNDHQLTVVNKFVVRCSSEPLLFKLIACLKQSQTDPQDECALRETLIPFVESISTKNWILVEGNSIYSPKHLSYDLLKLLNSYKVENFSDYLYKFFSLQCGTIAHFNRHGWWDEYQPASKFLKFVAELQEKTYTPDWYYDVALAKSLLANIAKEHPVESRDYHAEQEEGN